MKGMNIVKFLVIGLLSGAAYYLSKMPLDRVLGSMTLPYINAGVSNFIAIGIAVIIAFGTTLALFSRVQISLPSRGTRTTDLHAVETPIPNESKIKLVTPPAQPPIVGAADKIAEVLGSFPPPPKIMPNVTESFGGSPAAQGTAQVEPTPPLPLDPSLGMKPVMSFPMDTPAILEAKAQANAIIEAAEKEALALVDNATAAEEKKIALERAKAMAVVTAPITPKSEEPQKPKERMDMRDMMDRLDEAVLHVRRIKTDIEREMLDQEIERREKNA